jgi:flagellar motor switch protein FliM
MEPPWECTLSRELSQQEIDSLFRGAQTRGGEDARAPKVVPFDFRRLDRIPKSQLRAIRLLHDNFVRNLTSSLSAYLRTYLAVNLVSVEQLSYAEFLSGLASPTCLFCLGLKPFEGSAVLELNPQLTFPILEFLLGGKGKISGAPNREITEIERHLIEGLLRIVLKDLKEAWESVTSIDFTVESMETEPQLLQVLDPGEAFVATGIEVRIGGALGMMNLAIPSLIIKMMRSKFNNPGGGRRSRSTEADQARMLSLIRPSQVSLDVRLTGPRLTLKDLMALEGGDLLPFDTPTTGLLDCMVNGNLKFRGQVVRTGGKRAFLVEEGVVEVA